MAAIRYRILGPLEVSDGRDLVAPSAPKQRLLLGVLLCHANRVLSADRLQDELWGDHPPATSRQLLHGYVFQLRRLLADPDGQRLATRPSGYQLVAQPGELDADCFTELVQHGRQALQEHAYQVAADRFRAALALWRGSVLADVAVGPSTDAERTRLEGSRLAAAEGLLQAELAGGRHREVLPQAAALGAEFPLQEEILRCLMLALYRSGRQAEALAAYRALRHRLVEELGIEPSPPLQQLQRQILAADGALQGPGDPGPAPGATGSPAAAAGSAPVPPGQLPADLATFTGRDAEVAWVAERLSAGGSAAGGSPAGGSPAGGPAGPAVVAIYGPAGVGKSALARHVAHQIAGHYPDGVLYIDLHGSTPALDPLGPHAVLVRMLGAFGVAGGAVPASLDAAAALFRSLLAARRTLVLLDNAAGVTQVRPLLPAGAGCGVLLTSRAMLATLDSASQLELPALPPEPAVTLLARLAGPERVRAEPEAAAAVAEHCGYLPLALRIAGARLAARPRWPVRALADRLADQRQRLDELTLADLAVRTSFQVGYQSLAGSGDPTDQAAAGVFRMLGLLDGRDTSAALAAVLAGRPAATVAAALERLVDAQLLATPAPDRYRLHDLLRLFARELAAQRVPPADRQAAVVRALRCYLATARRAVGLLVPAEPRAQGGQDGALRLDDRAQALAWLAAERGNLPAVVRQAAADPATAALAAQLAAALFRALDTHGYWHELTELNQAALAAAALTGDRARHAQAHNDLGAAYTRLRRFEPARAQLEASLAIRRELADRPGLSASLNNLGIVYRNLDRLSEAVACFEESLALRRQLGDRRGEARALDNLGQVALHRGQYQTTLACQEQSLAIARELADRQLEGLILGNLADTCRRAGDPARAMPLAETSLAIGYELGSRPGQAMAQLAAGLAREALGEPERARAHWRAALELFEGLGSPQAGEVRAMLARLTPAPASIPAPASPPEPADLPASRYRPGSQTQASRKRHSSAGS